MFNHYFSIICGWLGWFDKSFNHQQKMYPLVMTKWPIYRWFTYYKWWFSMAMLNNQRVLWIGIKGMIIHQPWDCVNMEKNWLWPHHERDSPIKGYIDIIVSLFSWGMTICQDGLKKQRCDHWGCVRNPYLFTFRGLFCVQILHHDMFRTYLKIYL